MLHAKLLAGAILCHTFIAICAGVVRMHRIEKGDEWSYFDCYYFSFVTFSSIGFGDFAVGPSDNTTRSLLMLLLQAVFIYAGMAFFNSFAGVSGEWSEASYLALPACRTHLLSCKARAESKSSEQSVPVKEDEENAKQTADAVAEEMGDGEEKRGRNRMQMYKVVLQNAASATRSTSWLVLYIIMILAGGYTFVNIEAVTEATEAQALRDKENSIRVLAGMPPKGVFAAAEAASGEDIVASLDSGGRRLLSPTAQRLVRDARRAPHERMLSSALGAQTAESVRAELVAVSEMSEADQAAAVEKIVESYTEVVDHEQGCDQYADLTKFMLDNCKSQPPDPVSLNWSFNGAIFFMLTVMTTIGYGTFAPETAAGKFVVISIGYISLIVFGIHLGAIGAEIEALVEWEAKMILAGITWLEKKIADRYGKAPDLDGSKSGQGLLHCKMAAATFSLHCYLAISGAVAYLVKYLQDDAWEYGACYYFAFASFSTIGFGDFAIGPRSGEFYQLIILLVQAPILFLGLATFNTFASVGGDWVKEAVPSLPLVLGFGCALGIFFVFLISLPSSVAFSLGLGIALVTSFPRLCCMSRSPARVLPATTPEPAQPVRPEPSASPEVSEDEQLMAVEPFQAPTETDAAKYEPASPSLLPIDEKQPTDEKQLTEQKQPMSLRLRRGFTLGRAVLYRLAKQTLAGYLIMVLGGLLLYAAESQTEMDNACSARAEENLKRAAMRLLPMVDEVCP